MTDPNHYRAYICNIQAPKIKCRQLRVTESVALDSVISMQDVVVRGNLDVDNPTKLFRIFNPTPRIFPSTSGTSQDTTLTISRDPSNVTNRQTVSIGVVTNQANTQEARISSRREGVASPIPIVLAIDDDPVLLLTSDKVYTDNMIQTNSYVDAPYIQQTNIPVMGVCITNNYVIPRTTWDVVQFDRIEPNNDNLSRNVGTNIVNDKLGLTYRTPHRDFMNINSGNQRYRVNCTLYFSENPTGCRGIQIVTYSSTGQELFHPASTIQNTTHLPSGGVVHISTIVNIPSNGFMKIFAYSSHDIETCSVIRVTDAALTYCQISLY